MSVTPTPPSAPKQNRNSPIDWARLAAMKPQAATTVPRIMTERTDQRSSSVPTRGASSPRQSAIMPIPSAISE